MLVPQWEKSPKKQSEGVRFFVNSALKIQCHIVKNMSVYVSFAVLISWDYNSSHF